MSLKKRLFAGLLALGLVFGSAVTAFAADKEDYTYTVRIYAGAQGTVSTGVVSNAGGGTVSGGGSVVTITGVKAGSRVVLNNSGISLNNGSKYTLRGFRVSGQDNDTVGLPSFVVDRDIDYVAAYSLNSGAVKYTVRYVNLDGAALAEEETGFGNPGEYVFVGAKDIDNYQPRDAYNQRAMLSAEGENIITFYYVTAVTPTVPATTTAAENEGQPGEGEGQQPGEGEGQPGEGEGQQPGEGEGQPGEGEGQQPGEGEGQQPGENEGQPGENGGETTEPTEPAELVDVEDPQTPLANNQLETEPTDFATKIGNLPVSAKVGIGAGVIAIVGGAGWLLLFRKKRKI